jgi:AraC family transcriptional regulator
MRAITLWDYKKRMLRVLSHIQQHLDDPLELGQLARLANFSPYHFHRVFAGMVGEPLREYIRRLRLERAALKLSNRKAPVIEIALGAGYQSHEAFTRAFRGGFGMSPSRFRGAQGRAAKGRSASGLHYRPDAPIKDFRTRCESMEVNRVGNWNEFLETSGAGSS